MEYSRFLCSDCHMKITRGVCQSNRKKKKKKLNKKQNQCLSVMISFRSGDQKKNPRWQWALENDIALCEKCYNQKELDYQNKINFCLKCGKKIGFIRYNPKPKWKIDGQLCRKCWDTMNVSKIEA